MNDNPSALLAYIDGSGSEQEHAAMQKLKKLDNELPNLLLRKYRTAKEWKVRTSCVYYSIPYAREVEDAVALGVEALVDRSKVVRFRACMLLAYSLKKQALPALEKARKNTKDDETLKNLDAAIDAILNQNSNYFVDRKHSGKMFFSIQKS
jgi:hypothetical protein